MFNFSENMDTNYIYVEERIELMQFRYRGSVLSCYAKIPNK